MFKLKISGAIVGQLRIPCQVTWEDSHGAELKDMKQVMYLPHEIVGSFYKAGCMEFMKGSLVLRPKLDP